VTGGDGAAGAEDAAVTDDCSRMSTEVTHGDGAAGVGGAVVTDDLLSQ
jgi:hypothetical protein